MYISIEQEAFRAISRTQQTQMLYVPLPQVGPVKLVAVQSQINLFQPSVHSPPFMQGCKSH